jgi:predicted O-methyltransferase YrrM
MSARLFYRLARQLTSVKNLETSLTVATQDRDLFEKQRNDLVQERDDLKKHADRLMQNEAARRSEVQQLLEIQVRQRAEIAKIQEERNGFLELLQRVEMNRDALRHELNSTYNAKDEAQSSRDLLQSERNSLLDHLRRLESELVAAHLEIARRRTFVSPGHFYSPIVETTDKAVSETVRKMSSEHPSKWSHPLLKDDRLKPVLDRVLARTAEIPWQDHRQGGWRYGWKNDAFGAGDATVVFAMMAELRPRRWIEIGCGFSTCATLDAAQLHKTNTQFTFVEPYPDLVLSLVREVQDRLLPSRLQDVDLAIFEQLEANDVLFIDSSHVLKTGSDVHDYLFRILPVLKPGVVVHIHDVFYPFEYPASWIVEENRSWNEVYALHAFLSFNAAFEVIFFNDYCFHHWSEEVRAVAPNCLESPGGSIWLRKTA